MDSQSAKAAAPFLFTFLYGFVLRVMRKSGVRCLNIFPRGAAHEFPEKFCVIGRTGEAALHGNVSNTVLPLSQERNALPYAIVEEVVEEGLVHVPFKQAAALAFAHVDTAGDIFQRNMFHIMFVYECDDPAQTLQFPYIPGRRARFQVQVVIKQDPYLVQFCEQTELIGSGRILIKPPDSLHM